MICLPTWLVWTVGLVFVLPVVLIIAACALVSFAGRGGRNPFN